MKTLHAISITGESHIPHAWISLYNRSFPRDERIPFSRLLKQLERQKEMLAWFEDDTFIGLSVIFFHEDLCYLAYLVIDESHRNKGYGSAILQKLEDTYRGKRIVIDIEEVKEDAPDYEIRRKRREFYYRSGFQSINLFYHFFHVDYELLSCGGPVTKEEYHNLILYHWGKIANHAVYRTQ